MSHDDDRFQHDLGQLGRVLAAASGIDGSGILMTITNSTISGNSARASGGGVFVLSGDVTVRHSTITGNRADSDNNASGQRRRRVRRYSASLTIDHTIVAGNLGQASTRDDISGAVVAPSLST